MKKYIIAFVLVFSIITANAQTESRDREYVNELQYQLQEAVKPSNGDYYEGLTKKITFDRMIPPYGLEVTFDKTVHVIFPAPIQYVDLGSNLIVAGKAGTSENVIRIKAAVRNFETETNMAVITEEGSYYTLNINMQMNLKN